MPVRHQRSSFVRRSGTRRKVIWATSQVSNTQLNPGVNITPIDVLAGLESGGVGIIGGTVVRAHVWTSFSAADTDASPSFIWGLSMWDKSSLGTSNPNVQTDFYADWLMLREISPHAASVPFKHLPMQSALEDAFDTEGWRPCLSVINGRVSYGVAVLDARSSGQRPRSVTPS